MNNRKLWYALTIDKARTTGPLPTKTEYIELFMSLQKKLNIGLSYHPVKCFEYKKKGKKGLNLTHKWIHFHACVYSNEMIPFKEAKCPGYSINLKYLRSPMDIVNWCGYVQKAKTDQVDLNKESIPMARKKNKKNIKKRKVIKILDFLESLNS